MPIVQRCSSIVAGPRRRSPPQLENQDRPLLRAELLLSPLARRWLRSACAPNPRQTPERSPTGTSLWIQPEMDCAGHQIDRSPYSDQAPAPSRLTYSPGLADHDAAGQDDRPMKAAGTRCALELRAVVRPAALRAAYQSSQPCN